MEPALGRISGIFSLLNQTNGVKICIILVSHLFSNCLIDFKKTLKLGLQSKINNFAKEASQLTFWYTKV